MHGGLGCRRGTRAVFFVIARSTVHRKAILIQKASAFPHGGNVWANKRFLRTNDSVRRYVRRAPFSGLLPLLALALGTQVEQWLARIRAE